ncbi:hypothetical protein, partial [Stenotrophomonas maltophilia]|uniref:hypothetical protein n=1 Tax=Stenotrophomonas maltophilia TaxID=40324 RepID=UPI00195356A4
ALGPRYLIRPILLLGGMAIGHALGLVADAVTAMACAVIATWATAIVQFWLIQRRLAGRIPAGPKRVEAGFWLKTSAAIFLVEAFY